MNYHYAFALLTVSISLPHACQTYADSAALRAAQSANANLLYKWSFEGDETQRLSDTAGHADVRDLQADTGINGGNAANISFPQGFDSSSTAFVPERFDEGESGAGLRTFDDDQTTDDDLFIPTMMTVEVLFKVDSTTLSCTGSQECLAYGPNTRQWPQRRGYYLVQDNQSFSSTEGDIAVIIGSSFNGNRRTVIDSSDLVAGDWYYYAVTMEASDPAVDLIPDLLPNGDPNPDAVARGSDTFVNAYWANISAGDTTLRLGDAFQGGQITVTGGFSGPKNSVGFGRVGIGTFSENVKQNWGGALDEVAFYDDVLSQADLQANLDALLAAAGTPGDFDDDGDVDGTDFLVWQRGASPSAADLLDWQNNYGAPALAAVAAVPEPSTALIVQAIVVVLGIRRRIG